MKHQNLFQSYTFNNGVTVEKPFGRCPAHPFGV